MKIQTNYLQKKKLLIIIEGHNTHNFKQKQSNNQGYALKSDLETIASCLEALEGVDRNESDKKQ